MAAGFSFGTGSGGFNFTAPTSTPATTTSTATNSTGISFLTPAATSTNTSSTTSSSFKFPVFSTETQTTSTGVSTPGPNFNFNLNPTPASSSSTGSSLFTSSSSSAAPSLGSTSLNFTNPVSSASAIGTTTSVGAFSFTPSTVVSPIVSATTSSSSPFGPVATLSTATTTSSFGTSGAGGATNLSMRQLEERLNKWLVELKEQEERFIRQASHVNAWDQILQNGHDQVQSLKDTLHTVKSDQSRLEAEIDFIRGQQEELERLLEPLESATNANPSTQLHQGDRQRDNMYYLAQSLDAQLRQMTDDLGKVIEHLNTNSGSWQPNDPVSLVARILSAHMDTLKWVDQNTSLLSQKIEDVARVTANAGKRA